MTGHPEKIMCIKSDTLFKDGKWQGLKTDNLESYRKLIIDNAEFRPRDELEDDPTYKQVIAQVVLRHEGKYFLHRQEDRTEDRLNSLSPLPLGGHIEEFDNDSDSDIVEVGLERELEEEVDIKGNITNREFLGIIYIEDDKPVNMVHVGLFYIFDVDTEDVHIKEEGLKDIGFVSLDYLKKNEETLTYWSRIVIYHL